MNGDDVKSLAFAIEVLAFLRGSVREDDLEWDSDPLREWYIRTIVDKADEAAYKEEQQLAEDEARESILHELQSFFRARSALLSKGYPFRMERENGILLRREGDFEFSVGSACYLWLALFRASHAQSECLVMMSEHKKSIHTLFTDAFELVVAFAALGGHKGYCWRLGSSRDTRTLNKRLNYISRRVGSGLVKSINDLAINQANDNDGGIDVIHYKEPAEPQIRLIGATIQRTNRRNKIMTEVGKKRFRRLFQNEIALPHLAVLAVPFDSSEAEELNCAEADCHYYHGDLLIDYIGRLDDVSSRTTRHITLSLAYYTKELLNELGVTASQTVTSEARS